MRHSNIYINSIGVVVFLMPLLLLLSCQNNPVKESVSDTENTPTQKSFNHSLTYSGNGYKKYKLFAPEIVRYELAKEPKTVYPKGIEVETYKDSTLNNEINSEIRANHAIYYEKQKKWHLTGNVIANNYEATNKLETEELFWDEKSKAIYTDKLAKVTDNGDVWIGTGFKSDQNFDGWSFKKVLGRIKVQQKDTIQKIDR